MSLSSSFPHTVVSSLTNRVLGASKLLKTWTYRISVSDVSQECVHNHLIKLLVKLFLSFIAEEKEDRRKSIQPCRAGLTTWSFSAFYYNN